MYAELIKLNLRLITSINNMELFSDFALFNLNFAPHLLESIKYSERDIAF